MPDPHARAAPAAPARRELPLLCLVEPLLPRAVALLLHDGLPDRPPPARERRAGAAPRLAGALGQPQPRPARHLQVLRLLHDDAAGRSRQAAPLVRGSTPRAAVADRHLLLHLRVAELRHRHLPRAAGAGREPARLLHLHLLLPAPGGRAHHARLPVPPAAPASASADPRGGEPRAHRDRIDEEEHHRRPAGGEPGRPCLRNAFALQLGRAPLRRVWLRPADLLRLLRLQRHRHRLGAAARAVAAAKLRPALPLHLDPRVLAALAHHPLHLAARLPLHVDRRRRPLAPDRLSQPLHHHAPRRALARSRLDLRGLGRAARPGARREPRLRRSA